MGIKNRINWTYFYIKDENKLNRKKRDKQKISSEKLSYNFILIIMNPSIKRGIRITIMVIFISLLFGINHSIDYFK